MRNLENISEQSTRTNFDCVIAPWNYVFQNILGIHIRYQQIFSFNILINNDISPMLYEKDNHFIYLSPSRGHYEKTTLDRDTALVKFHQKMQNTKEIIIYSPNKKGIYTVIFNSMRIIPKLIVDFVDKDLYTEIVKASTTNIKFKVKNQHGDTVKKEVQIMGIQLDARLY